MKELILNVKHVNWGVMGPGDWKETEWNIYSDYTVDIKISYNSINKSEDSEINSLVLTKEKYDDLVMKFQLSKENNNEVDACDGSAWEIVQYSNGNEIWKRQLGYIYGISSLEEVAKILNSLVKD